MPTMTVYNTPERSILLTQNKASTTSTGNRLPGCVILGTDDTLLAGYVSPLWSKYVFRQAVEHPVKCGFYSIFCRLDKHFTECPWKQYHSKAEFERIYQWSKYVFRQTESSITPKRYSKASSNHGQNSMNRLSCIGYSDLSVLWS